MHVTSQTLQKVGKGTAEKMSLQTTAMQKTRRGDGADVTWRGNSFQTQAVVTRKSSFVES